MIPPQAKKQIFSILAVLVLGSLAGVGLVLLLLTIYTPSKNFEATNVLVNQTVLEKFWKGKKNTFSLVFEGIEYLYHSAKESRYSSISVDLSTYSRFLRLIQGDRSVEEEKHFGDPVSRLVIYKLIENKPVVFQEIEFSEKGDAYRTYLVIEGMKHDWVIFYHPHILKEAEELFIHEK